jgi:uncharacterized membrane protein YwzB
MLQIKVKNFSHSTEVSRQNTFAQENICLIIIAIILESSFSSYPVFFLAPRKSIWQIRCSKSPTKNF